MDFSVIFKPLLDQLHYIIPAVIFITFIKSRWFKGKFGEFMVNSVAKARLDKDIYHLIKNVTLPTENGTTQIDHVIISIYGVFVIETKNMKGWIFGNKDQKTWTQKIFKETNKFQNPLFQNYKHTKTLESLLGLSDTQIFSVIAFVGDSTFKTEMPENVTTGGGYVKYIKSKTGVVLTPADVTDIITKIENGRLTPSFKTDRAHVAHVREIIAEKSSQTLCPKCGSVMVIRESKRGDNTGKQFWGCTNYPRCRGIINISESAIT